MLQELESQMKIAGTLGQVSRFNDSRFWEREMYFLVLSFPRVCALFFSQRFLLPSSSRACTPRDQKRRWPLAIDLSYCRVCYCHGCRQVHCAAGWVTAFIVMQHDARHTPTLAHPPQLVMHVRKKRRRR